MVGIGQKLCTLLKFHTLESNLAINLTRKTTLNPLLNDPAPWQNQVES